MEVSATRDQDGVGMAYVRCNDGSIWMDTGNETVPWRRLPAIPEPTAEEEEEAMGRMQAATQRTFDAAYMRWSVPQAANREGA
jgi:hypothetical protein